MRRIVQYSDWSRAVYNVNLQNCGAVGALMHGAPLVMFTSDIHFHCTLDCAENLTWWVERQTAGVAVIRRPLY